MVISEQEERELIERLARLEESAKNSEKTMRDLISRIDTLLEMVHQTNVACERKHGLMNSRVSALETELKVRDEDEKTFYIKLGLYVTVISVIVQWLTQNVWS